MCVFVFSMGGGERGVYVGFETFKTEQLNGDGNFAIRNRPDDDEPHHLSSPAGNPSKIYIRLESDEYIKWEWVPVGWLFARNQLAAACRRCWAASAYYCCDEL